jgi:hypothetical protein
MMSCQNGAGASASHVEALYSSGTSSKTEISGRQLNRTGHIAHPIPLEMKTFIPLGDFFNPLE